jgi:molecular chaperone HtpG
MTETQTQQYSFQAEIKQLLHLLSHSLYQNREITIRELISNASDALDKFRYQSVTSGQGTAEGLGIWLEPDKDAKILVIRDNGIGMTQQELIANLGTIARSGSLEFLKQARSRSTDGNTDLSLIGQFGVGFYSAFMLAEKVEVVSRSATAEAAWRWESTGDGNFTVTPVSETVERGTSIRLHLKEGMEEFTEPVRLKYIVRKYSTFVPHAIHLDGEHVNDQPPVWLEPKSSVSDEQYQNFYEYLTHFPGQKPTWHLHLAADSPFQFHSILYCPDANLERMGFGRTDHGLHLCARRILVQNDNRDLLPDYLRFLRGIVDSADLPLNVSREALQDNTVFRKMQKVITRKVLDHLDDLATEQIETYGKFYREFGVILREGVTANDGNRDRVAGLLRFSSTSTAGTGELVSLQQYVDRAKPGQEQIYYACGTDQNAILRDPNLEVFRKRSLEVLVLADPADEYVLSALGTFAEKNVVSIDAAELQLPPQSDEEKAQEPAEQQKSEENAAGVDLLIGVFREVLGDRVKDVRRSERLTESVCCLVNAEGSMSTTMQRILRMNTPEFEMQKMILELNPQAPLVQKLAAMSENSTNPDFVRQCALQLHANAMIQAGLAPDGNEMAARLQNFMLQLATR